MKIREDFLEYLEGKRDLDELHKACATDPELAREWEEYQKMVQIEAQVSSVNESLPDAFVQRVWGTILRNEQKSWLEGALQWYRDRKRILVAVGGTCIAGLICLIVTEDMWKEVERTPVGGTGKFPSATAGNTDVLVPLKDIQEGTELDPSYFGIESRPVQSLSSNVVRDLKNITGKYAASDITAGTPLLSASVTENGARSLPTNKIPEGYKMVTVPVDATSSVEGWARPGAGVDLTWIGEQNGEPVAKIVVEHVEVLAYSSGKKGPDHQNPGPPHQISLLVTKDDALKIQLARTTGRLSLSLRTDKDLDTTAEKPSIGMGDVIKSSEDKGTCQQARKRGIIDQINAEGKVEKMVLDEKGALVPLSKFCPLKVEEQAGSGGGSISVPDSDACSRARKIARLVVQSDGSRKEMFPDDQGILVLLSEVCRSKEARKKSAD